MHAYLDEATQDRIVRAVRGRASRLRLQAMVPAPLRGQGMINRILTVGGLTLLSRVTGFLRDIVMAAVLGAGPVADAFFVAFRLPNHFRAIFAEGAFTAAFVPAYARIRAQGGPDAAKLFGDRIFTLLLASQIVLLAIALALHAGGDRLLAPGFRDDPTRFDLAVELTRITFPVSAADDAGDALSPASSIRSASSRPRRPRRSCSTSR